MKIILAILALLTLPLYGQAWSYRGIPYPTSNVPGAIMPTLPTGADTAGWPYDPCSIATPVFSNGAAQYYVDSVNGNDGTAGNSGRGSVALPRQTLPGLTVSLGVNQWTFTEGMQVFITGNSTAWGAGTDTKLYVGGTTANPCWIIGVGPGQPNFGGDKFFISGTHLMVDNCRFVPTDGSVRIKIGEATTGTMAYCGIRNCTVTGLGTAGSGENAAVGGTNASFVMLYKNTISNFGKWDRADASGVDRHGIQPTGNTKYWWFIENEIFHMEGDSIQIYTTGANHGNYNRPHYMYIAGNEMYENYEQSVDCKNSFHVIISQNRTWNLRNIYKTANNVSMLISNDGEGWLSGYQWAIYNTFDDVGVAMRIAGNQASSLSEDVPPAQLTGAKGYAVGNVVTNSTEGIRFDANSTTPDGTGHPTFTWTGGGYAVDNSFHVTGTAISQPRISQGAGMFATYEVSGNLIYRTGAGADIVMSNTGPTINTINVLRNLGYSPSGSVPFTNTGGNTYDSKVGNLESTNPLLVNPPTDMTLNAGSPAIGANAESPVYQLFQDMYGLDIRRDYSGAVRPVSTWDIGAYEFSAAAGSATATSGTATTLSAGP